ncbi:hypothetical protein JCM14719A_06680 [Calditerricola satsumensis]|uniref:DUF488 family protein n=1 Tax=Calditerricola satsumensis TaxID=373054 RepID=A0A8J3BEJ9_9BACI|nr:hypothetical protein GCM10007043_14630 [Calditerricola satsumensis]
MEIKKHEMARCTSNGEIFSFNWRWRVLVDRLWPRGLAKDAARIDVWMKEVAPSPTPWCCGRC